MQIFFLQALTPISEIINNDSSFSTLVPVSKPGFWSATGVTRTLVVTYSKPVKVGMPVIIESEVVNAGKRLCKSPIQCSLNVSPLIYY